MKKLLRTGIAGILMVSLVILGLVTVAGCTEELTPEEAQSELCAKLGDLEVAVAGLGNLPPGATVDDLKAAAGDIRSAYDDVEKAAEQVAEVNVNELQQSVADLESTVDGIPGDATIGEALAVTEAQWTAVVSAWQNVRADANCGEQPAESPTEGSPTEGSPAESP
jgi:outer membrane murein-binding lipoprotein Lpp